MKKVIVLFIVFISGCNISAQGNFKKSFHSLSKAEWIWVLKNPFYAVKAYKITKEVVSESKKIIEDNRLDHDHNCGQADAFRHLYWMARLTQKIGGKRAFELGIAHEKANYEDFLKDKSDQHDSAACAMDLFNNNIGIAIGEQYSDKDADSLKTIIIESILKDKALIVYKDALGRCLDYDHEVIDKEKWQGKWKNKRVLVFSNQKWKQEIDTP